MSDEIQNILFETFTVGPLAVNCYILGSRSDHTAIVIDAGGDHEKILSFLEKNKLRLKLLINTHAHFDHVGGVWPLQDLTGARFLLHQADVPLLNHLRDQTHAFALPEFPEPNVDGFLRDNEEISVADNERLRVIHTPGHSPGSVCLLLNGMIFVGDTLFASSIGRTDLYGGSHDQLIRSVKTRLFTLGDHVIVYPGHGPSTTIGVEKQYNPFFTGTFP